MNDHPEMSRITSASRLGLGAVEVRTAAAPTDPSGITLTRTIIPSFTVGSPASALLYASSRVPLPSSNTFRTASALRSGADADSPVTWTDIVCASATAGPAGAAGDGETADDGDATAACFAA